MDAGATKVIQVRDHEPLRVKLFFLAITLILPVNYIIRYRGEIWTLVSFGLIMLIAIHGSLISKDGFTLELNSEGITFRRKRTKSFFVAWKDIAWYSFLPYPDNGQIELFDRKGSLLMAGPMSYMSTEETDEFREAVLPYLSGKDKHLFLRTIAIGAHSDDSEVHPDSFKAYLEFASRYDGRRITNAFTWTLATRFWLVLTLTGAATLLVMAFLQIHRELSLTLAGVLVIGLLIGAQSIRSRPRYELWADQDALYESFRDESIRIPFESLGTLRSANLSRTAYKSLRGASLKDYRMIKRTESVSLAHSSYDIGLWDFVDLRLAENGIVEDLEYGSL